MFLMIKMCCFRMTKLWYSVNFFISDSIKKHKGIQMMIYSEFNQLLTARESYKISHVKFREKSNNSYGWQQFIFIAK